jgi:hypothetical protein
VFTAGQELSFLTTMLGELGVTVRPQDNQILVDASSVLDVSKRKGLGRLKHLELKYLWIQSARHLTLRYVETSLNIADMFTKYLTMCILHRLAKLFGITGLDASEEC